MLSERKFIQKIVRQTGEKFDCICWAMDNGVNRPSWNICIDDYDLYRSEEFRQWSSTWHSTFRNNYDHSQFSIVFCYCNPIENNLWEYSQKSKLIM